MTMASLRTIEQFSLAEAIEVKEVEERILTACKTLRAVPDPDRRFQWMGSTWPEMIQSAEDAYGYTEAAIPRFRPSPANVSDYLTALSWARGISWKDFRLVWWRSADISFGSIGDRINKSDETARRRYRDILLRLWYNANSQGEI